MSDNPLLDLLTSDNSIQITAYVVDGPNDFRRPPELPGRSTIAGLLFDDASKFQYREVIDAYLAIFKERLLRELEESGILQ